MAGLWQAILLIEHFETTYSERRAREKQNMWMVLLAKDVLVVENKGS